MLPSPRRPGESDLHYDARLLLESEGWGVTEIKHVAPDSIVFTDRSRIVRTGWTYLEGIRPRAFVERGMPAWPSIDLPPRTPATVPDDQPESD